MKRIAIVVQRYAAEITGGAERHARLVAELLAQDYSVEVLTSCALDYVRWDMHYLPGAEVVGGIIVRRFANTLRNDLGRARVPLPHKLRFKLRRLLRWLPGPWVAWPRGNVAYDGVEFLRRQGPHCPRLFEHLSASRELYDAVIFFTALYETAALGVQIWGPRSILVPLLHDEKPMYQPVFHQVFRAPGRILFNSTSERRLAAGLYGIDVDSDPIAGIGVEMPEPDPAYQQQVMVRFGLAPGYLIYVGRVDVAKGVPDLIAAFLQHARHHAKARLVLVGHAVMPIPANPRIVHTGFVSEAERDALVAGAVALVIPSRYESLSAVLLEAMLLRTPVIANGRCEVLADHIRDSGAGIAYRSPRQLRAALATMDSLPASKRQHIGELGRTYVTSRYTWDRVKAVFDQAIDEVSALPAKPPVPAPLTPG